MPQGVSLNDPDLDEKLAKSDQLEKVDFEASVERGVQSLFKAGDDFVIWGPASVEIVDQEGAKSPRRHSTTLFLNSSSEPASRSNTPTKSLVESSNASKPSHQ